MRENLLRHHPDPDAASADKFAGAVGGARKEVAATPEKMPNGKLGDLLASVGNSEMKAIVLGIMQTDEAYTHSRLSAEFHRKHGGQPDLLNIHSMNLIGYCANSLEPAGLVDSSEESTEATIGKKAYRKTSEGEKNGDALAGHLLAFSERYPDIPLQSIFGPSRTPGNAVVTVEKQADGSIIEYIKRSPLKNYHILKGLVERDEPASTTELIEDIGEEVRAQKWRSLNEAGLITYKTVGAKKAIAQYTVKEDRPAEPPPLYLRQRGWTTRISKIALEETGLINTDTISAKYLDTYPQSTATKAEIRRSVSAILGHLAKVGYLNKDEGLTASKQTQISLSPEQRAVATDLVQTIERFRSGDEGFLQEGRDLLQQIVEDPQRVAKLALKAKERAKVGLEVSRDDIRAQITAIIAKYPKGISVADVYDQMKTQGSSISQVLVRRMLMDLRGSDAVSVVQEGRPALYGLITEPREEEDVVAEQEVFTQPVKKEIVDTGERISEGKLGDLLAAFGNHEAKAITLLVMGTEEEVHTRTGLYKLYAGSQQGHVGWQDMSETGPIQYCKLSLAPIGLVAKETIVGDIDVLGYEKHQMGYRKTEEGTRIGDALAGHLLAFSERHPDVGLQDAFGLTTSPSYAEQIPIEEDDGSVTFRRKRTPYVSFRLYKALLQQTEPIIETDLQSAVGHKITSRRLYELQTQNMVQYESVGDPKAIKVYYTANPNRTTDQPYRDIGAFTDDVAALILQEQGEIHSKKILETYLARHPENDKDHLYIKRRITTVLSDLAKRGFINREEGVRGDVYTQISVSDEQRAVIEDLVSVLERFQSGDPEFMRQGRQLGQEIISDPERVAKLAAKAKEKSKNANAVEKSVSMNMIEAVAAAHPEGISATDIQAIIAQQGSKLARESVRKLVAIMRERGDLIVVEEGTPARYTKAPANETEQETERVQHTIFEASNKGEPAIVAATDESIANQEAERTIFENKQQKGKSK